MKKVILKAKDLLNKEVLVDQLMAKFNGLEEDVENDLIVIVYDENFDSEYYENLKENIDWYIAEPIDDSWKENWKSAVKPFLYKNFYIHPPWVENKKDMINIIINPGMAFGTGDHPTTQLCLKYLIDLEKIPYSFLDVGTGSGVLAMVGYLKGIAKVEGFDIDSDAIESAKENLELNNLQNKIELKTATIDDYLGKKFELIIANMITERLKKVIKQSLEILDDKGKLVLSGILEEEMEEFQDYLIKNYSVKILRKIIENKWGLLEIVKN